jgi:hemolysin III
MDNKVDKPVDESGKSGNYEPLRPGSAITHGIGMWLASVATAVLISISAYTGSVWKIVSYSIYGATLIGLYAASTLYHSIRATAPRRAVLRKLDHIMIFMLIAGTYTPICLVTLRQERAWGWALFGAIWGVAILGLVIKLFFMNAPRWLSTSIYILMGWMALIAIVPLVSTMARASLIFLALGGVFYTVGAVFYALKWPGRENKRFGFHEVFHVFVMLGSACQFAMMLGL